MKMDLFKTMKDIEINDLRLQLRDSEKKCNDLSDNYSKLELMYNQLMESCHKLLDDGEV